MLMQASAAARRAALRSAKSSQPSFVARMADGPAMASSSSCITSLRATFTHSALLHWRDTSEVDLKYRDVKTRQQRKELRNEGRIEDDEADRFRQYPKRDGTIQGRTKEHFMSPRQRGQQPKEQRNEGRIEDDEADRSRQHPKPDDIQGRKREHLMSPRQHEWHDTSISFQKSEKAPVKRYLEWDLNAEEKEAARLFEDLGIDADLCKHLVQAFPYIRKPTQCQEISLKAISKPSDIILRAHTASGKSFGILLALLGRFPGLLQSLAHDLEGRTPSSPPLSTQAKISYMIMVPTQELAAQYEEWAYKMVPESLHAAMPTVLQAHYRTKAITVQEHIEQLKQTKPRILVITSTMWEEMNRRDDRTQSVTDISFIKTLVLDEVDSLLQLPSRFPSKKSHWKHTKHQPPALLFMNIIMKKRATFSGGERLAHAGLEVEEDPYQQRTLFSTGRVSRLGKLQTEKFVTRTRNEIRRNLKKYLEENQELIDHPSDGSNPFQLIVMSATANSVLRHFLGARTGWLRTGLRDERRGQETGKLIDLTGMSTSVNKADEMDGVGLVDNARADPVQIPREIKHFCVAVDGLPDDGQQLPFSGSIKSTMRNLDLRLSTSQFRVEMRAEQFEPELIDARIVTPRRIARIVKEDFYSDGTILTALAYLYAKEGVRAGLAVVPSGWSIYRTVETLQKLGVPARELEPSTKSPHGPQAGEHLGNASHDEADTRQKTAKKKLGSTTGKTEEVVDANPDVLWVLSNSMLRGVDFAGGISHIFCVGISSIVDTTGYIHLSGRVSRLGSHVPAGSHKRPPGKVITLLRGVPHEYVKKNASYMKAELKHGLLTSHDALLAKAERIRVNGKTKLADDIVKRVELGFRHEKHGRPQRIVSVDEVKMSAIFRRLFINPQRLSHATGDRSLRGDETSNNNEQISTLANDENTASDEMEELASDEMEQESASEMMAEESVRDEEIQSSSLSSLSEGTIGKTKEKEKVPLP